MNETPLQPEEARRRLLSLARPLPSERCAIAAALHRGVSEDLFARRTLPRFDNSAMDGYAVRSSEVPGRLPISGQSLAGMRERPKLPPGATVRIMTGAPLPEGADAVVMQEQVRVEDGRAVFEERAPPGQFVRARGEDVREGDLLLPRGATLGIPELGLLLAQGLTEVAVPRRPRVAILSTGDELVPPGDPDEDGLVDTNGPTLAALVQSAGGVPTSLGIAKDTLEDTVAKLSAAVDGPYDLVITSAGASVGERDFVKEALAKLSVRMDFFRVAIKPGKPLAVGALGDKIFVALPGNPVSSLVTFELFLRPLLKKLAGRTDLEPSRVGGRLEGSLKKPAGLTHYVRVKGEFRDDGALWVSPLGTQSSGALSSAVAATHLLEFPADGTLLTPSAPVRLLPLAWSG